MGVRLLPKSEVAKKKAEERRQQIAEGLRIAEKVDSLRETLAKEETAFSAYRAGTLDGIQEEIDAKHKELESVSELLAEKRSEWEAHLKLTQEPIDKQWLAYVKGEKARIEAQVSSNEAQATRLASERASLKEKETQTIEREEALTKEKEEYLSLKSGAVKDKKESERIIREARTSATKIISEAEERAKKLDTRQKRIDEREENLRLEEENVKKEKAELTRREFAVLSRELQLYSPVKKL